MDEDDPYNAKTDPVPEIAEPPENDDQTEDQKKPRKPPKRKPAGD